MKIYQISGLGGNQNAFKNLRINQELETVFLPWVLPEKAETIAHYSQRMMDKINFNEDFILMGLSFGGIIVNEMNRFADPKLNILISTVKSRNELPRMIKFSSRTKIHKLIPTKFLSSEKGISYALIRKFYSSKLPDINDVFVYKEPAYLKWSINEMTKWKDEKELKNYLHFHGDKDMVFPFGKIQNPIKIEGGTHVMVLQKARELSRLINQELTKI